MLLALRNMGGESEAAWRALWDDLGARGLAVPELVIVDGASGLEKAITTLGNDVAVQRCTVHKHRNLLAHAPKKHHDEISADYADMIYANTAQQVEAKRKAFLRKWRLRCPPVADSLEEAGEKLFTFLRFPPEQSKSVRTTNAIERLPEEFKRRIKTQCLLPCAETACMLFWAFLASGQINLRRGAGWDTFHVPPAERTIDLAARMHEHHEQEMTPSALSYQLRETISPRTPVNSRSWGTVRNFVCGAIVRRRREPAMAIKKEFLDELLAAAEGKDVFGKDGLFDDLKKALAERMLNAEMDHHLGQEAEDEIGGSSNHRNGYSRKKVLTETAQLEIAIPRDRQGTFDPKPIAKYQRRFAGFDDKIVSMYARGLTVREIQSHLLEIYGIEISPDLVSTITEAVLEEVAEWQSRPLEATYAIVLFDALRVKVRDEGTVRNKAIYLALGIRPDGSKEPLGLWIEQTEGAKFWLRVMNDLKARGVNDILIATVDGLKGFPEAIGAVFPQTLVQTCIVHLIRHSMGFASWKERKPVTAALRDIYRAKDAQTARQKLDDFDAGPWGRKYPAIASSPTK